MNSLCPACHKELRLNISQVVDEQVIACPHCNHQFQIQLSPATKQVLEMSNQSILGYMSQYPHHQPLMNDLPSGVQNTIE